MAKKNKTPLRLANPEDYPESTKSKLETLDIDKAMDFASQELKPLGLHNGKLFDVHQKATLQKVQYSGVVAGGFTCKKFRC